MNTLRYILSAAGYRIMARNLKRYGYSCLQVADAMTCRLALDRFDEAKYHGLSSPFRNRFH
jgi:hypothetical protein